MATVDIIVPVYNVEKYIDACMESLLGQTNNNFRIILIDDGSTDQSGLICDRYANVHNNIIVKHKENGGLSSARNVGLSMVEAPYFMFVDSDDYLRKDALEILFLIAEKEDADVVKFEIAMTDEHGAVKEPLQATLVGEVSYQTKNQSKEWLFTFGHATAKLYKTLGLKKILFPEGLIYEDYYYSAVISSLVCKIVETPEKLYFYRENPHSITHTKNDSHKNDKYRIFDEIVKYYNEHGIYEEYKVELEYLYSKFCFVNACKTAVISYRKPYQFVRKCAQRIKQKYPKFRQNEIFLQRCTPAVRMIASLILISPAAYVCTAELALMMKRRTAG